VSAEEERVLRDSVSESFDAADGEIVVRAGIDQTQSTLLVDGLACGFKDLANGERQIVDLFVPGDFLDLHSFPLKRLDVDMMALAPSRFAHVPHDRLLTITEEHPHLTRLLWFSTLLDASIHRGWLISIAGSSAKARIAHLFCELYYRMRTVELNEGPNYRLALTQAELAQCVGITTIHANRTLRSLRVEKLVTFRDGIVTVQDLAGLERLAEFDPAYLHLERRAR
jgi:CRP-like cAMP-binding protein